MMRRPRTSRAVIGIALALIAAAFSACESLQDDPGAIGRAGGAMVGGVIVATSVAAASATH